MLYNVIMCLFNSFSKFMLKHFFGKIAMRCPITDLVQSILLYKLAILLFLFSLNFGNSVYGQGWQWAKSAGSTSSDHLQQICTDNTGNSYIIGSFGALMPSASWMIFNSDTVWNNGVNQIFIAKYSNAGNLMWAKGIGGQNDPSGGGYWHQEGAYQIIFDSISNALYMTGCFFGTAPFGNTSLYGNNDLFLTKIDLTGNFIWAKKIACLQSIFSTSIATNDSNEIYISGNGNDIIQFDSTTIQPGGFIAKYSASGNLIWVKQIGQASNSDECYSITSDINSNIYISGNFVFNYGYLYFRR